ncbi:MAG: putative metal-binding motif-containing protein [Myxococcota bacterium]|nr:putative metal-binding motif-containing protein [Myxococcota bacterium]
MNRERYSPGLSRVACLCLLLAPAAARAAGEDLWLASDRIALGLHPDGSLVNHDGTLGLLWDSDGTSGDAPLGTDLLTPGYPYEIWTVTYRVGDRSETVTNGGPHLESGMDLSWGAVQDSGDIQWIEGSGTNDDLSLTVRIELPWESDHFWIWVEWTALTDVDDLWMARVYDPDFDSAWYGSYVTTNLAGDGYAASASLYEDEALSLSVSGGTGGLCSWCTLPEEVLAGTSSSEEDENLGITVELGSLAADQATSVSFAYAFAGSIEEALEHSREAAGESDHDADGVTVEEGDCNDADWWIGPDFDEWADGLDNDCDGIVDEDTTVSDDDGDGYTEAEGDCDDADALVYPGAEGLDTGADGDCDGQTDGGSWPPEGEDVDVTVESGSLGSCACTQAPGRWSASWALLVGLLAVGRRRR